jgi:hypothetical protein
MHSLITASLVLQLRIELAAHGLMDELPRPASTSDVSFLGLLYKRRVTAASKPMYHRTTGCCRRGLFAEATGT